MPRLKLKNILRCSLVHAPINLQPDSIRRLICDNLQIRVKTADIIILYFRYRKHLFLRSKTSLLSIWSAGGGGIFIFIIIFLRSGLPSTGPNTLTGYEKKILISIWWMVNQKVIQKSTCFGGLFYTPSLRSKIQSCFSLFLLVGLLEQMPIRKGLTTNLFENGNRKWPPK